MSELSKVSPTIETLTNVPGASADGAGDSFINTGDELLLVEHTDDQGSDVDLTFEVNRQVEGLDVPDRTLTIGAGERALIGPFSTQIYNDADGKVQISYSAATNINVAVIKP